MSGVRAALLLTTLEKYSVIVIQFASSLIIARLLSPQEIGIFSIGAVLVAFSHIFRDMGIQNYLIQERELTADRIRASQAWMLCTSWTIAVILVFAAGPVGLLYQEPGLVLVLRTLAISFVLLPFGGITLALLRRDLKFAVLYGIGMTSALVQAITAIGLAWAGFGFMSLAWASVAGAAATTLVALFCRRPEQPWWPSWKEGRRVISAGSRLSAAALFYEVGLGGPELVTGRVL